MKKMDDKWFQVKCSGCGQLYAHPSNELDAWRFAKDTWKCGSCSNEISCDKDAYSSYEPSYEHSYNDLLEENARLLKDLESADIELRKADELVKRSKEVMLKAKEIAAIEKEAATVKSDVAKLKSFIKKYGELEKNLDKAINGILERSNEFTDKSSPLLEGVIGIFE